MSTVASNTFTPVSRPGTIAYKPRRDGGMLLFFKSQSIRLYCNSPTEPPWSAEKMKDPPVWQRDRGGNYLVLGEAVAEVKQYREEQARARAAGEAAPHSQRTEALASFLEHFQPEHLQALSGYWARTFNFYSAIRRCPGLLDLACSDSTPAGPVDGRAMAGGGALAYVLSNAYAFIEPSPKRPLDVVRRLVRRKRRDIAVALGFPRKHAGLAVRVMGSMPRSNVNNFSLLDLRGLFVRGDRHAIKLLTHAEKVNSDVISLLKREETIPFVTANLVAEVAAGPDDLLGRVDSAGLLRDAYGLVNARRGHMLKIRSLASLLTLHNNEVERALAMRSGWRLQKLPSPPVRERPGVIEYVSSSGAALYEEGKEMHNCVSGYASRVASGECFIYRVLSPERCTLSIALGPDMRFHISELKGPCNAPLKLQETLPMIETWLNDGHDPEQAERVRTLQLRSGTSLRFRREGPPPERDFDYPEEDRYELNGRELYDAGEDIPF